MTLTPRPSPRHPEAHGSEVVVLRSGTPYFKGLCDTYHELKLAMRAVEYRTDPASIARTRQLDRARHLLLEAIVKT